MEHADFIRKKQSGLVGFQLDFVVVEQEVGFMSSCSCRCTSPRVWLLEQLFERVAMRGEEQFVLVPACRMLRLDDVP